MPTEAIEIENLITKNIPDSIVTIKDLAGDGNHYSIHVISPSFSGQSRVAQHKMVYAALEGLMDKTLHALQISTACE